MRRTFALVAACLLALVLVACGDDDDSDETTGQDETTSTTEEESTTTSDEESTSTSAGGESDSTVAVADSPLGDILVDGEGFTVYLFTRDSGTTSACTGDCASTWPPVAADGTPTAGEGVDQSKLTTITRDDGSSQVAYNGHPLYRFAPDAAAGDTGGHGVGGNWFAVTPAGEAVPA